MDNVRENIVKHLALLTKATDGTRLRDQNRQQACAHYCDIARLIIDNNKQLAPVILNIVREAAINGVFDCWAVGMASLARENVEQKYLEYGIVALALSNCRGDFREEFTSMCLLYHSSVYIGVNFDHMLLRLRSLFPKKFARIAHRFIDLDPSEKSLAAIGYHEVKTSKGIAYVVIN